MTGYMYSEALGKLHWLTFVGVNLAFFRCISSDCRECRDELQTIRMHLEA
jgi:hypothetical protein